MDALEITNKGLGAAAGDNKAIAAGINACRGEVTRQWVAGCFGHSSPEPEALLT